ncbi:MAG: L-2-hydroxyglutarate oxidase [Deltaproteobacteria bacterium]|nr:L-2-hydroxyglutarate oxidase [Deltaproteobacteria bacterium]
MSSRQTFDVAIIGGGIIGTATAMTLASRPGVSVVIIEAEDRLAAHQTGNNSGVVHSGLYYKPGSLKARNCVEGREAMYRFCEEHDIAYDRCGKVVVATREAELPFLENLLARGEANGLNGLKRIGPEEIRELEPHIDGIAGLRVPETGIVDFVGVTQTYARLVEEAGGEVHLGTRFLSCARKQGELVLETTGGVVRAKNLINCGGLQCDRIARICGVDPGMRVVPFRGEYYELAPERHGLVRNLVYPVPDPRFPFLGVHFTRMVLGGVEAGPNAVLALKREGYTRFAMSLKDIFSYLSYGGFWKMAAKYGWTGFGEIWRSLSKRAFIKALRRLMPELKMSDVHRGGAGVRAQALTPSGAFLDDFHIVEAKQMIHVLNAPSPAATASLSIGRTIAEMAEKNFELG